MFPTPPRRTTATLSSHPREAKYTDSDIGFVAGLKSVRLTSGRFAGRTYEEASQNEGYITYLRSNSYRRELRDLVRYHDISAYFNSMI